MCTRGIEGPQFYEAKVQMNRSFDPLSPQDRVWQECRAVAAAAVATVTALLHLAGVAYYVYVAYVTISAVARPQRTAHPFGSTFFTLLHFCPIVR